MPSLSHTALHGGIGVFGRGLRSLEFKYRVEL